MSKVDQGPGPLIFDDQRDQSTALVGDEIRMGDGLPVSIRHPDDKRLEGSSVDQVVEFGCEHGHTPASPGRFSRIQRPDLTEFPWTG